MQKRMSIGRSVGFVAVSTLMATGAYAADKIGVTMPNIKGPWFTPVLFGVTDEAKKLNYDVIIQDAGGYGNVDKQVSQLSNLLVQKVKAILLDPANPDSFNGVVRQAKSDKIPVVGVGSPIVASNVEADGAASSSHCNIGHELAKGAKTLLPNGGTIAILAGPPGAFWASDRLRCFKEDIAGSNIKIVAEQTSEQDAAVALSLANDMLQRHVRRWCGTGDAGCAEVWQGKGAFRRAGRGRRGDYARRMRGLCGRAAAGPDRPDRRADGGQAHQGTTTGEEARGNFVDPGDEGKS